MTADIPDGDAVKKALQKLAGVNKRGELTAALHAYIENVLCPGDADSPEGDLGEHLYCYFEEIDCEDLAEAAMNSVGGQLMNKHAIKLFVHLVQEGHNRRR